MPKAIRFCRLDNTTRGDHTRAEGIQDNQKPRAGALTIEIRR